EALEQRGIEAVGGALKHVRTDARHPSTEAPKHLSTDNSSPAVRVLIAGVSTRAAVESATRAGFAVTAIDAFGDLDQHASVCSISLPLRFTAHAAARAARGIDCEAVAYLSSFENHPGAV